jgi:iron complex transport system substrate-binding protein
MRICSLLPGATEVVAALAPTKFLVGISHECDYPPDITHKPVVVRETIAAGRSSRGIDRQVRARLKSGQALYEINETLLARVRPHLVIAQDTCDVCAVTPEQLDEALRGLPDPPRVLSLNPSTLDDVLADIQRIGYAIRRETEAALLAARLRERLQHVLLQVARAGTHPRVACLEWLDPLYAAGHWVPEMVAYAGGVDVLGTPGAPAKKVTWKQVCAAKPDVLVLMPCGFSIDRTRRELALLTKRAGWKTLPAVKSGRVFLVDGPAYFNRPGPRLVDGVEILAACLHPSLMPAARPEAAERLTAHRSAHRKSAVPRAV